ncbi:SH3 domain-containing protein [Lachnospiraceae bacterium oral taxon 096]|jgi:SH3 domain protein|nr:SH3 domain-containing protein [Lachnospiraceae bacterium]QUI96380.1 SH3 domain-containing protein [Lachnospiraceae bacterium oral taxon 096]
MGTIHSEVLRLQREMELSIQEKNYALAIAKSRQLLEMMVDDLCQKYNVHGQDLSDRIDALSDILSFETQDHFHAIRKITLNKENTPSSANALKAERFLLQEIENYHELMMQTTPNKKQRRSYISHPTSRRLHREHFTFLEIFVFVIFMAIIIFVTIRIFLHKNNTIEIVQTTVTTTKAIPVQKFYFTTANLNVRRLPSMDGEIIATLPKGSKIEVIQDYDANWCEISYGENAAYVSRKYIVPQ